MKIEKITAGRTDYYAVFTFWTADKCVAGFAHRVDVETNEILFTDRLTGVADDLGAARIKKENVFYVDEENRIRLDTPGFDKAVAYLERQEEPGFAEEMTVVDFLCALFDFVPQGREVSDG